MKRVLWIVAFIAVVAAGAGLYWWWQAPVWPTFTATSSGETPNEPQVIVQVKRDYAYRIGDLIVVDVFVRQQSGVAVNANSLAIGSDFELAAAPTVQQQSQPNGVVLQRLHLQLQSFLAKPELVFAGRLGWSNGEQRGEVEIPTQKLYTSATYDGREDLQEGDDPRVSFWWYGSRYAVPLIASSLAFLVLLLVAVRNFLRPAPAKALDQQRVRVVALLEQIRSGQGTQAVHAELEALVRQRWDLGTVPASQLTNDLVHEDLIEFVQINSIPVYSLDKLDEAATARLCDIGDWLVRGWKAYVE